MKKILFILIAFSISSCASLEEQELAVKTRASYDLNCPENEIDITLLREMNVWTESPATYGAKGCDNRKNYDINEYGEVFSEGAMPDSINLNHYNYQSTTITSPNYIRH